MLKNQNFVIIFLHLIFLFVGLFIIKDYGIGLEENFQRISGFYWLKYLLSFTNFTELQQAAEIKLNELYAYNPQLPLVSNNLAYGIILDVPSALIEILINFKTNAHNIYLKHSISFFIFLISSFCFSLILKKRFSNILITAFGTIIYFLSPKIFGASFFDGKDIFFLSIFTLVIYFYQKYENNNNIKNLFFLSFLISIAISSRLPGLLTLVSFTLIIFFKSLCGIETKKYLKTLFIFIFFTLVLLIIQWPYLWEFKNNIKQSYGGLDIKVFFDNHFYHQNNLPFNYIPKWIIISTPIYISFLFLYGSVIAFKRLFTRIFLIKDNYLKKYSFDFWRGKKENLDFFILLCFVQTILIYLFFDNFIFSSWRHFYFVHFFICYFSCMSYNSIFLIFRKKEKTILLITLFLSIFILNQIHKLFIYHPFQNMYFNSFLTKKDKLNYERDTAQISRYNAIKEILKDNESNNKEEIKIGTASWSPLGDIIFLFKPEEINQLKFIGNNNLESADYIFTNYIYEVNINYNDKYKIPKNFNLFKSVLKDETLIYSIYKKK